MAMTCRTCDHPKAAEINMLLANGGKLAEIAGKYGMAVSSVHRHAQHLPKQVKSAVAKKKNSELVKAGEVWNARLHHEYLTACERGDREVNQDNPMWMTPRIKAVELGLRTSGQMGAQGGATVQVNIGCLVMPLGDQAEAAGEDDEGDVVDVECEDATEDGG